MVDQSNRDIFSAFEPGVRETAKVAALLIGCRAKEIAETVDPTFFPGVAVRIAVDTLAATISATHTKLTAGIMEATLKLLQLQLDRTLRDTNMTVTITLAQHNRGTKS